MEGMPTVITMRVADGAQIAGFAICAVDGARPFALPVGLSGVKSSLVGLPFKLPNFLSLRRADHFPAEHEPKSITYDCSRDIWDKKRS